MVIAASRLSELDFPKLMEVYEQDNQRKGRRLLPGHPPQRQVEQAREEVRLYLRDVFFRQKGAAVYVLTEGAEYLSALRMEPYQDGFLLQALETRPDRRRQGCAVRLIRQVLAALPEGTTVYSHVARSNAASLAVHRACGFACQRESAVMLDGTVTADYVTLVLRTESKQPPES